MESIAVAEEKTKGIVVEHEKEKKSGAKVEWMKERKFGFG